MSATLLEQARAAHDDIERLERLVVKELQKDVRTHKERLNQSHRVKAMVDAMAAATSSLVAIYGDADGARSDEIAALGGQNAAGGQQQQNNVFSAFSAFYDRLKEVREYHRRHPSAQVMDTGDELEKMITDEPHIDFSGEEGYGRFLDLHVLFQRYVNSKFGRVIEYSAYVEEFCQPHKLPQDYKLSKEYTDYLQELLQYLSSFFERTQPLQDIGKIFSKTDSEFEERWPAGKIEGWENKGIKTKNTLINLDEYHSPEELVQLGGDKLKEALAALSLKVGGTIQQRAERLWLTKFQPLDQLDKKHFAKGKPQMKPEDPSFQSVKEIAQVEFRVRRLCELLREVIEETKGHVEKKQALTYEEIEEEREEQEVQPESESEDEETQVYNPLKLPLGWDNKPIPYWLYKLHGLGQEFKCEICGNESYWGRRAFERHFKEWRHQHGMRCLGIPNTKNFHEITSIKDAKALWEKIQERSEVVKWRADMEEEYEDRDGNVYNKKTFNDLQRQGLI